MRREPRVGFGWISMVDDEKGVELFPYYDLLVRSPRTVIIPVRLMSNFGELSQKRKKDRRESGGKVICERDVCGGESFSCRSFVRGVRGDQREGPSVPKGTPDSDSIAVSDSVSM